MKLCAMFTFEGVADPDILHCTHKYFGDDYQGGQEVVTDVLLRYFSASPFRPFAANFSTLDKFGDDEDYRVVLADVPELFLPALKGMLDSICPDKFDEYRPHVTVGRNIDALELVVRDYVLLNEDHEVVFSAAAQAARLRSTYEREYRGFGQSMTDFHTALKFAHERQITHEK